MEFSENLIYSQGPKLPLKTTKIIIHYLTINEYLIHVASFAY